MSISILNGRWLFRLLALGLIASGLFALALGAKGQFLPHDEGFLGMTSRQLCALHACRIVHFMIHDRVSFGGALIAVGVLYLWLIEVPLRRGLAWAWWLLLLSGVVGFASFFAYLGYGYLDTWHGVGALGMFPCYALGLIQSTATLRPSDGIRSLFRPAVAWSMRSAAGWGRAFLLAASAGLAVGGFTILVVGMTCVFVPQDLAYMGLDVADLQALNPRLVPLIAHDRAGFGGAVCCCGVTLLLTVWCAEPSGSLWNVLALVGFAGFGTAIGIHPLVGYNSLSHLGPAMLGACCYLIGLVLTYRSLPRGENFG